MGRRGPFAVETGDLAIGRVDVPFGCFAGRASRGDQPIEPAIEVGNDVGKLARGLLGAQIGPQIGLVGVEARKLIEPATDVVKAILDLGQIFGRRTTVMIETHGAAARRQRACIDVRGVPVVVLQQPSQLRSGIVRVALGAIADDRVEPFADRHAGTARGFLRGIARLRPYAFHLPRNARSHARIHGSTGEEREPDGPV